ncbi:MAG TPA: SLC13 family permease, partial [Pirellulales bacterium]|nr:SLC13 family permease [Pirellulales bacterium]
MIFAYSLDGHWPKAVSLGTVVAALLLLTLPSAQPDLILMGSVVALVLFGILTPSEALEGLSNEGMVTVAVLYVVGAGVRDTGAIDWVAAHILGRPRSERAAITRLALPTTVMSAFINNTPLVAMLLPVVDEWCRKQRVAASKLMIPLSYAAILGGTCTLIGTSTNLVVDGLFKKHQGYGLGMFDITWVGLPAAIAGCAFLILVGPKLLPDRRPAISELDDPREYTAEMVVPADSPLAGRTIEEAGLRHLPDLYLAEIDRDGTVVPADSSDERLRAGDRLVFVGVVESVVDLQKIRGLAPATDQVFKLDSPRSTRSLVEAV